MTGEHSESAIACRDITRYFGRGEARVEALRGVDLDVYYGQLTLLAGPSGCGKTTLLSIIAGLLPPTDGQVRVLDVDVNHLSQHEKTLFRRYRLGFVFQHYDLLPAFTAAENAAIPLVVAGLAMSKAVRRAGNVLAQMELAKRAASMPATLSGGEQQRVAIARALVHEPQLVLCDEPTAAVDARTGKRIMQLLREAASADRAVLVVTHDPRVMDAADRIAEMDDGRIVRVR